MADEAAVLDAPEVTVDAGYAPAVDAEAPPVETTVTETPEAETGREAQAEPTETAADRAKPEEEKLEEFTPSVSARLREYTKQSPELKAAFDKNPKLRGVFEATFRRESAYRELFPTIADAKALADALPNGVQDLEYLQREAQQADEIDNNFLGKDASGQYSGHAKLVANMHEMDPSAYVALVKTGVRDLAQRAPQAYEELFGGIMGATLREARIFDFLPTLAEAVKDNAGAAQMVKELAEWLNGFNPDQRAAKERERGNDPEAKRLREEREAFERERQDAYQKSAHTYREQLVSQSANLQKDIVLKHPLIARLPQTIPQAKRDRIVGEVVNRIKSHLWKSPTFRRGLTAANGEGLQQSIQYQKTAWSNSGLLNRYVRAVLAEETPVMVTTARPGAGNPAPTRTVAAGRKPGANGRAASQAGVHKRPEGWFDGDRRMTTEEVLRLRQ